MILNKIFVNTHQGFECSQECPVRPGVSRETGCEMAEVVPERSSVGSERVGGYEDDGNGLIAMGSKRETKDDKRV